MSTPSAADVLHLPLRAGIQVARIAYEKFIVLKHTAHSTHVEVMAVVGWVEVVLQINKAREIGLFRSQAIFGQSATQVYF